MARKYGMIPSKNLISYKLFSAATYHREEELPEKVDLRQWCSPVMDQGTQGSCTSHAITGLREYLGIKNQKNFVPLSRAFLYYEERQKEGTTNQDAGAMPADGMDVLKTIGVCPEADMPYNDREFTTAPTIKAVVDATLYTISEYHAVTSVALMKAAVAEGNPVVLGICVYDSFESKSVAKTGIIPLPNIGKEQFLGGHCVLVVGYDMNMSANGNTGYVIIRNSWGADWGDKGYCYLPFDYFTTDLVSDYWVGTL